MRRGAGILLLVSLMAFALPCLHAEFILIHAHPHHGAQERRGIEHLEDRWLEAVRSNDASAMAPMLAESYIGIGPDGTIDSKSEELAARSSGQEHIQQLNVLERRIRIYGSTAVVTSRVELQGEYSGQPLLGEYRYTRVWSLQRGQWRIVSFEASRIHDSSARSE